MSARRPAGGAAVLARPSTAGVGALLSADEPWRYQDLTRVARAVGLGAVLLVAGWIGASGTPLISRQLSWAAVSVLGVIVAGIGMSSWLIGALRLVGQVSQETLRPLDARAVVEAAESMTRAPSAADLGFAADTLVTAEGMTRYHRADCLLARGKALQPVTRRSIADLDPCGVCQS